MVQPYVNVTMGLVSHWERGEKRPRVASLKLMTSVCTRCGMAPSTAH